MAIAFIDLKSQYRQYKKEIDEAIAHVIDNTSFILGKEVSDLEQTLSRYVGVQHTISCSSGTDALFIALMALQIKPGDEVITTPFTFFATAEVIALVGATPVFVDIRPDTYNIDSSRIAKKITKRTKAIIPVDIFGQVADFDEIIAIANSNSILVIEDAAQSFGAIYRGQKAGSLGTIACTSFFPAKPLGCFGDGGAVFLNNDELASRVRAIMNHGQTKRYVHSQIGVNGRLDTIQAAVLLSKLNHYDKELIERTRIAKRYREELRDIKEVILPVVLDDRTSVYAQFSIQVPDRAEFIAYMQGKGIPTAIHYPIPLYRQEAFSYLNCNTEDFPVTEHVCKHIVSLPMSAFLTEEDQTKIIDAIRNYYGA